MLTISKSLSAGQARTYHSREFTSEEQNYWSRDQQAHSEWQGKLAQEWGLHGEVGSEHFARLSEGQHPENGVQLVKDVLYFWHSVGNRLLTLVSNMFTDLNLTDMETCYKVFRRNIIKRVAIAENRFGFEPEITAKVAKLRPPPRHL